MRNRIGTLKVTIGVGGPQGRQFEELDVTVDTGSTYTEVIMAKNPRNQRKTPKSREPKRAAVYVDELLPIEERQQELVNMLRNVVKNPEHYDGIIVYGSPTTDVNEHVKDAIALLTEHGTEVTFIQ